MKIIEERIEGELGRDYIEGLSTADAHLGINSQGSLAEENAYGEIVAIHESGQKLPIICGHGGSMWLCRKCKDEILKEQNERKITI